MTSNVPATLAAFGALAPASGVLAQSKVDAKTIAEGIGPSFGILTYRGKVWRLKYRGDEHPITLKAEQAGMPDTPAPYVDVVIVNASPTISKIWYDGPYQEGDSAPPDCFSTNGVTPDPSSPKKQAEFCATCPKNVWGSKANVVTGAKGKACQDSKRLAVVPLNDLNNEQFGGPMLMRVPPASLQGMGTYNAQLQNAGHTFYSVATRLQFDAEAAYPQILFFPIRALGDSEAQTVLALQTDARVTRMLTEAVDQVRDAGVGGLPGTAQTGAQATSATAPAAVPPAGAPTPAVVPVPAAMPTPAPVATPVSGTAQPADDLKPPAFLDRSLQQPQQQAAAVAAVPPPTPPAPVTPPQPRYIMAQGETFTREDYHKAGWTDAQLVQAGKLTVVTPTPVPPPVAAPPPPSATSPTTTATTTTGRGRGRRAAAPQPSPSPAPTPEPVAATPPPPAATAAAPVPTPAPAPSAPAAAPAPGLDPALAALDAKLANVL